MRRVEYVGPQVGEDLVNDGGLAMLFAFMAIMLYVSIRFEWKLAVAAIIALFHDSIITIGFFSVFGWEFDLTVLSAVLALVGYSTNDKIVIYDRIREITRSSKLTDMKLIVNMAVNQTLSRTILVSFTVFLTLLSLFFLGGNIIHGFATAMLIGVVKGTYSSIYVGSALALEFNLRREDLMPTKKDASRNKLP
jgi:preprotein translocase subunit SecF